MWHMPDSYFYILPIQSTILKNPKKLASCILSLKFHFSDISTGASEEKNGWVDAISHLNSAFIF